jgi:hypothetical protein
LLFFFSCHDVTPQVFDKLNELELFNVQMHIHGHSHHNASNRPGSIQWHTHQAAENNVDMVWFSEHDGMLNQKNDLLIEFNGAHIDHLGNIDFNRNSNFLPEFLEKNVSNGISKVELLNDSSIYLELSHLIGNKAQLSLVPRTSKGKLGGFRLPRPISSNAVLKFDLNGWSKSKDNVMKVIVELSWHITETAHQQRLEYIFSDKYQVRSVRSAGNGILQYLIPFENGQTNHYELNIYEDASLLDFGQDNTITDLRFVLSCQDFTSIGATISNISLFSLKPEPENQMKMVDLFSKKYQEAYEVVGISGIEYSPFRKNELNPHFNIFLPNSMYHFRDIVNILPDDKFNYRALIDHVHSMGGLISLNHIFGTSFNPGDHFSIDMQQHLVDSISSIYMEKELYDVDILEVGYLSRGGANLESHLKIWDIFTANGYFLYGNGTTDAHGGIWKTEIPNPFTTWIWSEDLGDTSIIKALESGSFYFGTLQNKIKKFYFKIDDFEMGDRKYTDKKTGDLHVFLDPLPYNYTFRLVQGTIDFPGGDVHYIRNVTFDPEFPPVLDLNTSCFVRLEIESKSDNTKLFSNPIILLKRKEIQNTIHSTRIFQEKESDPHIVLFDPYPNPAIDEAWIPFKLNGEFDLSFTILSSKGEVIHKINLGKRSKGEYLSKLAGIYWDLKINRSERVKSGIYYITLDNFDKKVSKKIIVK